MKSKIYNLYDKKTKKIITSGTPKEIANYMGKSQKFIDNIKYKGSETYTVEQIGEITYERDFTGIYALYKHDDILCVGTVKELAKFEGCSESTIRTLHSRRKTLEKCKNAKYVIRLEDDD